MQIETSIKDWLHTLDRLWEWCEKLCNQPGASVNTHRWWRGDRKKLRISIPNPFSGRAWNAWEWPGLGTHSPGGTLVRALQCGCALALPAVGQPPQRGAGEGSGCWLRRCGCHALSSGGWFAEGSVQGFSALLHSSESPAWIFLHQWY